MRLGIELLMSRVLILPREGVILFQTAADATEIIGDSQARGCMM